MSENSSMNTKEIVCIVCPNGCVVETQSEATRIEQENERLNVEIAKLKNPERIKSIAESQLGMQVPKKTYFAHESK